MGQTVAHLTDFSEASAEAFFHALALALAYKHRLYLLHVKDPEREDDWSSFPHVREALARWGLVAAVCCLPRNAGVKCRSSGIAHEHHLPE